MNVQCVHAEFQQPCAAVILSSVLEAQGTACPSRFSSDRYSHGALHHAAPLPRMYVLSTGSSVGRYRQGRQTRWEATTRRSSRHNPPGPPEIDRPTPSAPLVHPAPRSARRYQPHALVVHAPCGAACATARASGILLPRQPVPPARFQWLSGAGAPGRHRKGGAGEVSRP